MATIHTERNFEPSDYVVLDYLDNKRPAYCGGPVEGYVEIVKQWEGDMERALGADWRAKSHRCVHCGNGSVRWITAVLHKPTNDRVVFGADCTERLGFENHQAFKLALLKKRAAAHAESLKAWLAREKFVAAHPSIAAALTAIEEPVHAGNHFVKDVLRKLDHFGTLSDKQVAAVEQSLARDVEHAAKKAAEAVEPKGDAPEGRQEVTGEVLSVQSRESDWGEVLKMLVKLENNSKVWVSVPGSACGTDGGLKGKTITIRATFERSKDDKSFAFGKRPTLVGIREAVA
jgi:hypothetical protein